MCPANQNNENFKITPLDQSVIVYLFSPKARALRLTGWGNTVINKQVLVITLCKALSKQSRIIILDIEMSLYRSLVQLKLFVPLSKSFAGRITYYIAQDQLSQPQPVQGEHDAQVPPLSNKKLKKPTKKREKGNYTNKKKTKKQKPEEINKTIENGGTIPAIDIMNKNTRNFSFPILFSNAQTTTNATMIETPDNPKTYGETQYKHTP